MKKNHSGVINMRVTLPDGINDYMNVKFVIAGKAILLVPYDTDITEVEPDNLKQLFEETSCGDDTSMAFLGKFLQQVGPRDIVELTSRPAKIKQKNKKTREDLITDNKLYVTMTNKYMSGWGTAENKIKKYVIECDNTDQAEQIQRRTQKWPEMECINININKPYYSPTRYTVTVEHYNDLGAIWTGGKYRTDEEEEV